MLYHKNTFFTIQFIINKPIKQKVAQWRLFYFPQQFLYFFPEPHGHWSFLPTFGPSFTTVLFIPPSFSEYFPSTKFIAVSCNPVAVIFAASVVFGSFIVRKFKHDMKWLRDFFALPKNCKFICWKNNKGK